MTLSFFLITSEIGLILQKTLTLNIPKKLELSKNHVCAHVQQRFSTQGTRREPILLKQDAQLLLVCFPDVIKRIGIDYAFLILMIKFYHYYFTYKYNLVYSFF